MRKIIIKTLLGLCLAMVPFFVQAQEHIVTLGARQATCTGAITLVSGPNGREWLKMDDSGEITYIINVSKRATYNLKLKLQPRNRQYKEQFLFVNEVEYPKLKLSSSTGFYIYDAGNIQLVKGKNWITIKKDWGYTNFENITISTVPRKDYSKTDVSLINRNANQKTKELYALLRSTYGKSILSGCTDGWYDINRGITGKAPVVVAYDFWKYTEGYTCKWKNNTCTMGAVDDKSVDNAIKLYNDSKGKQIISFQWHWYSPFGSSPGKNSYFQEYTTFDVTKAIIKGTPENDSIIRDIDDIAMQLKRLQNAGVPILFRPLHEAGGDFNSAPWFWWGSKGPGPAKQLWDILYKRITHHHNINNLIWVWSSPKSEWYPGNDKVDIIGYDSYPGKFDYRSRKEAFDQLDAMSNGKKLLALTENGPIPNVSALFAEDAIWSFFMTWHAHVINDNTPNHVQDVYNDRRVISLATPPTKPVITNNVYYCQYKGSTALKTEGVDLKWYTTSIGGTYTRTAPKPSTATPGTTFYYASQTRNGVEGLRWGIAVNVTAESPKPKVTSPVTYFHHARATPLTAIGSNLGWYTKAKGGAVSATAPKPNTSTLGKSWYYVVSTTTGCFSPRVPITVKVIPRRSASMSTSTSTSVAREEETDGSNSTEEFSYAIYPNPSVAGDELTISHAKNVSNVTVTDVYGNSETFDSPRFKTKLKGMLIIRVLDDQGEKVLKAVVY